MRAKTSASARARRQRGETQQNWMTIIPANNYPGDLPGGDPWNDVRYYSSADGTFPGSGGMIGEQADPTFHPGIRSHGLLPLDRAQLGLTAPDRDRSG
ncbi:MAG: hypothetical protein GF398_01615 [Chitinivibrionales bacterium]|nr:hypothetical protein [Chitinivibrionales bacterium]